MPVKCTTEFDVNIDLNKMSSQIVGNDLKTSANRNNTIRGHDRYSGRCKNPAPELGKPPEVDRREKVRVSVPRAQRYFALNPASISLVLLACIISNQSIMTIVSVGRNLSETKSQEALSRSLIALVVAGPAPEPKAASARTATSVSHRVPPINGSIFGKRSVDHSGNQVIRRSASYDYDRSSYAQDQQTQRVNVGGMREQSVDDSNYLIDRNEPLSYSDIVTKIIEDFLAHNNESKYLIRTRTCNLLLNEYNKKVYLGQWCTMARIITHHTV